MSIKKVNVLSINIIIISLLIGCSTVQEKPPIEYQGQFINISDDSIKLSITNDFIRFENKYENYTSDSDILKVAISSNEITVLCKDKRDNDNSEILLYWGTDNLLHVYEIIETGQIAPDGEIIYNDFFLGVFRKK